MRDAWQILRDGGLPLATPRSSKGPSVQALAAALREAIAGDPQGREEDALVAFVRAWEHHWPACFRSVFASDAPAISTWAEVRVSDPNRYLKLRRIAVENLASIL